MTVEKRGDKWCVLHCHGPDEGKPIKCFDTKEQADAMHGAIEANKNKSFDDMIKSSDFGQIDELVKEHAKLTTTHREHEEGRAPKDWWDKCEKYANEQGATDIGAYCGALWHYVGPSTTLKAEEVLKAIEGDKLKDMRWYEVNALAGKVKPRGKD